MSPQANYEMLDYKMLDDTSNHVDNSGHQLSASWLQTRQGIPLLQPQRISSAAYILDQDAGSMIPSLVLPRLVSLTPPRLNLLPGLSVIGRGWDIQCCHKSFNHQAPHLYTVPAWIAAVVLVQPRGRIVGPQLVCSAQQVGPSGCRILSLSFGFWTQ